MPNAACNFGNNPERPTFGEFDTKDGTVCPRSSDPFYIVTYYIKWVTTSWTQSKIGY